MDAISKQLPWIPKNQLESLGFLIKMPGSTLEELIVCLERNFSQCGRGLIVNDIVPDGKQGAWIVTLAKGFKRSVFMLDVLSSGGKLIEFSDPFDKSKGCFEVSLLEQ